MRTQMQMLGTRGKLLTVVIGVLFFSSLLFIYFNSSKSNSATVPGRFGGGGGKYSTQFSYQKLSSSTTSYQIAIVADRDTDSKVTTQADNNGKVDTTWESEVILGTLIRDPKSGMYSLNWTERMKLGSKLNEAGRAMELSELVHFGGRLLAFDDRTGVVSEIDLAKKLAIPRLILMEGDGNTNKGQKNEWATIKDGLLYVGSIGKEWTNSKGKTLHYNPQWVKVIDTKGHIESENWRPTFELLRKSVGAEYPGYVVHEAVCWNNLKSRWYFMPRRVSELPYDEEQDEERGSDIVISLDSKFSSPIVQHLGHLNPKRGFSSCKFVPFRENEFVALKTVEYRGTIESYITVIDLDGKVLMPEQFIDNVKFEGVEFI